MKDFFGEDLCAAAAQAYMESLLSGESGAKASEAAEIAYADGKDQLTSTLIAA